MIPDPNSSSTEDNKQDSDTDTESESQVNPVDPDAENPEVSRPGEPLG